MADDIIIDDSNLPDPEGRPLPITPPGGGTNPPDDDPENPENPETPETPKEDLGPEYDGETGGGN